MQQLPPVRPCATVPSASVLVDQQQLLPLQYPYALQQPQLHGTPFPLIASPAVTNAPVSSSAPFPAQFNHLYPLGGQIANFTNAGQEQLQKQHQNSTTTGTMAPHSSEIIETVKNEQQKQTNGTTAKAEQRKNGDEVKNGEEKRRNECQYGPIGGMFGAISADYGEWMATAAGQGLVTGYPPMPPPIAAQMPPSFPIPLGTDELGVMYGPNGLMNVSASGLHYEIDPTMGGYEGIWTTGGGYYLGADQQAKILTDHHQHYLNTAANTVDGAYGGGGNGGGTAGGLCANGGANAFYTSLHQQGISPSALVDQSLFHSNSALPPPTSQLSSDPLYGQPTTFASLGVPPPPDHSSLPPALSSSEAAISTNSLFTSSQNGAPALLHQLDPSPSQQHSNNFYPTQFGQNVPPLAQQNLSSADATTTNFVHQPTDGLGKKGGQQKNNGGNAKRGRMMKTTVGGGTTPSTIAGTGRPSSSQATERDERRMGDEASNNSGRKMSRARSVTKESSDDDKSTEEKEQERRNANNTRERIRVRDINAAFKELARLCSQHMPNVDERGLTKLNTLLKAVELIPQLEKRVEEKNRMMSARKDCIKHRLNGPPICPLSATASQSFGPSASSPSIGHSIATQSSTTTKEGMMDNRANRVPTDEIGIGWH